MEAFDAPSGSNEPAHVPFKPRNLERDYVNPWTPDKIELVRELAAGGLTRSQIAKELGVTRNSAIGVMYRNGIQTTHTNTGGNPHNLPPQAPRKPKPKYSPESRRSRAVERTTPQEHVVSLEPPEMGVLDIMQLESHHCRFPVDGAGKVFYCGALHQGNNSRPWCSFHHAVVYRPETRPTPKAFRSWSKWLEAA